MTTLRRVASLSGPARYDLTYLAACRLIEGRQDRALTGLLAHLPAAALLAHPAIPAAPGLDQSGDPAAHIMVRIGNTRKEGR